MRERLASGFSAGNSIFGKLLSLFLLKIEDCNLSAAVWTCGKTVF